MYRSYISCSSTLSGSPVTSTRPRISTYRPGLLETSRLTRGSRRMLRVFSRPSMVLNTTLSPSRFTKITDDCGRPRAAAAAGPRGPHGDHRRLRPAVGVRGGEHRRVRAVEHFAGGGGEGRGHREVPSESH